MQLELETLRQIAKGVERVEQQKDGFHFYRLTAEQAAVYDGSHLARRVTATAGVRLDFMTDSRHLFLRAAVSPGSSRTYFLFDIYVNGARRGMLGNITENDPLSAQYPLGTVSGDFDLGEGEKHVVIYFPFSVQAVLEEVRLDDHAGVLPYRYRRQMLLFGDSITQGYDTRHPAGSYASRLVDALKVDGINKGIAADMFRGQLAAAAEPVDPAYITVAYGTNDWWHRERAEFERECAAFYTTLAKKFPRAHIFALAPIFRMNAAESTAAGEFRSIAAFIEKTVAPFSNMTFIDACDFVPHTAAAFADGSLHPCEEAFGAYFENLLAAMLPHLTREL